MFEGMVDPLVERFRPHALTIGDRCNMFATGVIERLDRIAESVQGDDTVFQRVRRSAVGAGATPVIVAEVPANQDWLLESIAATGVALGDIVLRDGGGVLLWAASAGASTSGAWGGNGLIIAGGSQVFITAAANAQLSFQFRYERAVAGRDNIAAGIRNPTPDRTDEADDETQRHMGDWTLGVPAFAGRRAS
jgi:hypothetical protein